MENLVYIKNISCKCSQEDLYKIFHFFGSIKRIKIFSIEYQNFNYPVGYACIQFSDNIGYNKCLTFDKNLILHNKKLDILSQKPKTSFPRSILAFFSSDVINEEYIFSFFQQNQPSKINMILQPTIHNYGFSIIEFSSVETRDIVLYDYFRAQSYQTNSTRILNNSITLLEPTPNLIELSINNRNKNSYENSSNYNFSAHTESFNFFNENDGYNSPSISFSPSGITYYENKYYERYLDLTIVHKKKEFRVNSFLSSTFSIRIRQLLMENSIIEKVETRFDQEGPFELVTNSLLGLPIDITVENSVFLFIASSDLGIEFLNRDTYGYVFNQMTIESAFDMHRLLKKFNVYEGPHSNYLSLHFDSILPKLSLFFDDRENSEENDQNHELHFLAAILRSKLFTVGDSVKFSEALLDFIKEKNSLLRRKFLIQFLRMKEMDIEAAKTVVDDKSINLNQISHPIFSFLKEKSKEVSSKIQSNQIQYKIDRCFYQNGTFSGVFHRLFELYGKNPHDLKVVDITSSSSLENIIDTNDRKSFEWISSNIQNSWFCVDFFETPIVLTSYALKYQEDYDNGFEDDGNPQNQLTSWAIEGSNDFETWVTIDERRDVAFAGGRYESYSYSMSSLNDDDEDDDEVSGPKPSSARRRRKRKRKSDMIQNTKKFTRYRWIQFGINRNKGNNRNYNSNNNNTNNLKNKKNYKNSNNINQQQNNSNNNYKNNFNNNFNCNHNYNNNNNNNYNDNDISNNYNYNYNDNDNSNNNNNDDDDFSFRFEGDDFDCFRFVRLRQIGRNLSGNFCLKVQGVEFYGSLPDQRVEVHYLAGHPSPQRGIFSLLFESCDGKNPAKSGIVSLFSSCDAKFLADDGYDGYWASPAVENAFVKFDLKRMKLELKSYSLKCHNGDADERIKSWKVEVSDDDKNWTVVDVRENIDDYKSPFETLFWECKSPYFDPVRYVRIVNMNSENNVFCIAHVELYGILHRP